jgi:hypothetical protein
VDWFFTCCFLDGKMQGSLNDFGIPREDSRTMQILMDVFRFQNMDTSTVIWHGSSDPQKVLQLHHREHPDWLHHCLEWQLLGIRLQGATEGSEQCSRRELCTVSQKKYQPLREARD